MYNKNNKKKRKTILYIFLLILAASIIVAIPLATHYLSNEAVDKYQWAFFFVGSFPALFIGIALFGFSRRINAFSETRHAVKKMKKSLSRLKKDYEKDKKTYNFVLINSIHSQFRNLLYNVEIIYKRTETYELKNCINDITDYYNRLDIGDFSILEDDDYNKLLEIFDTTILLIDKLYK